MATLLGTWELGLGYGHIAHLAPVAAALNDRGHRMVAAVRHPDTARAAPGAPFFDILAAPIHRKIGKTPATLTYAQVIGDGGMTDVAAATALVRAWLAVFDKVKPAAIVAEHAPASLLAAHVAGLPSAMLGAGWAVPPATRPFPSLAPWREVSEAERAAADAPADAVVRAVCRSFGVAELDGLAGLIERSPGFLTTMPEIDPYGPRAGATYYGTMSGFRADKPAPWPAGDGPRVFVYFPFTHRHAPPLIEAIGALGWPTVWHGARRDPLELPDNIAYSAEPLDTSETLADANLLVSRGGHATACEALLAGRPNLLLPDTLDTMLLSRRLNGAKLGIATIVEAADGLRSLLERLVDDPEIKASLAEVRARHVTYRPGEAAGLLVDRMIRELRL